MKQEKNWYVISNTFLSRSVVSFAAKICQNLLMLGLNKRRDIATIRGNYLLNFAQSLKNVAGFGELKLQIKTVDLVPSGAI